MAIFIVAAVALSLSMAHMRVKDLPPPAQPGITYTNPEAE